MDTIGFYVRWPDNTFDPTDILRRMRETFGVDFECDGVDRLAGLYERRVEIGRGLGIQPDNPVLKSTARLVREASPRYHFNLRISTDSVLGGMVDRYAFLAMQKAGVPDELKSRLTDFLRSLGQMEVHVIPRTATTDA